VVSYTNGAKFAAEMPARYGSLCPNLKKITPANTKIRGATKILLFFFHLALFAKSAIKYSNQAEAWHT